MGLMFVAFLFNPGNAKELKYFSNFKPGPIIIGPDSAVTDFVTMISNSVSDLPNDFTICTSIFIEVMSTLQNMFQILKEDGTYWFSISYDPIRHALMFCQNMKYKYIFSVKKIKV